MRTLPGFREYSVVLTDEDAAALTLEAGCRAYKAGKILTRPPDEIVKESLQAILRSGIEAIWDNATPGERAAATERFLDDTAKFTTSLVEPKS